MVEAKYRDANFSLVTRKLKSFVGDRVGCSLSDRDCSLVGDYVLPSDELSNISE